MTAVRRGPVSRLTRRTVVRANGCGLSVRRLLLAVVAAASLGALIDLAAVAPASAQSFTYNPLPPRPKPPKVANDNQMLVQATEVDYDYNNSRVSAVGNVQLFYNGTSVEADKVIYDQKTKRLHAEGNIRICLLYTSPSPRD